MFFFEEFSSDVISQLDRLLSNFTVNPKYGGFAKFYLDERNNTEVQSLIWISLTADSSGFPP
jgi:hypothetical protein